MEFRHSALDRYPLLTAVSRDLHGDYVFNHLIEGATKKPNVTEFLGMLADFKEKFQRNEEQLKEAKVFLRCLRHERSSCDALLHRTKRNGKRSSISSNLAKATSDRITARTFVSYVRIPRCMHQVNSMPTICRMREWLA